MFKRNLDPNVITKKQECYDFYNSFKGEKITFNSFYQLYRKGGDMTMEEMIQPKRLGPKKKTYTGKRAEEMKRYETAPEPKAKKEWFRNRLKDGYCKEDAVLVGEPREEAKLRRRKNNPIVVKKYVRVRSDTIKRDDPGWYMINVTYPKEVARIFRKEYQNMIAQIEWELTYTEEKTEVAKLNDKLDKLNNELNIFNSYNH